MKSAVHSRALLVCLVLVTGFSGLSARLIYLQWIDRDTSAPKAARNRTDKEVIPGKFGYIVDRNDRIMARNLPVTTVVADKIHLRDPEVAARGVAARGVAARGVAAATAGGLGDTEIVGAVELALLGGKHEP